MPERQDSSGEAIEQQVTAPGSPDGGAAPDGASATEGAAPDRAAPDGATRDGATRDGATREGATTRDGGASGGATSGGVTSGGASTDGVASNGAAANGAAPSGATTNGATTARPAAAPRPPMGAGRNGAGQGGPGQETPGSTPAVDRGGDGDQNPHHSPGPQDADGRSGTGADGTPTVASPVQAANPGTTSGTGSPLPSAQAHDGAVPNPTAPGRDPGPRADADLFTSPAQAPSQANPAPTNPAPTNPASAATANPASTAPAAGPAAAPGADAAGPGPDTSSPGSAGSAAADTVPAAEGPPPAAGTRPAGAPPGNGRGNGPSVGGAELFGSWDDESTRVLPRVPNAEASTQVMPAAGPPARPPAGPARPAAGPGPGAGAGAGVAGAGALGAMGATGPTGRIPAGPPPAPGSAPDGPPQQAPGPSGGGDGPTGHGPDAGDRPGRPRRVGLLVAAGVVGIIVLAYLGDLLFSTGSVPRGVTVAGQEIGGLSRAAAIEKLQAVIEPRSGRPVQVTAGPVRSEIDPKTAGLSVDYNGTLDRAGAQPLNPITRVSSFFTTRDVGVVNTADARSVRTAMEQLAPIVDRNPKDGTVRFDGLNPVPVAPEPGQRLDVDAAVGTLERQWASGSPVALPLIIEQAATTPGDVQQAIDDVAKPAVSAPLTVTGEGANATVAPEDIAKALTFKADPDGAQKLVPQVNVESLTDVVSPQLAKTEKPGVDATLDFASNPPKVVPSQDGRGIDYKATFANLLPVLTGTGPRTVPAVYAVKPPDITTAKIQSLGNAGEISTFTTGGFSADSGQNIKRAAEAIDGQVVQPGETFSLNGATNPRDASRGYVEAGIIEDGHAARGVGGGVSQLATTLYNASYFAGMVDVEHQEHSYYISRYPVAREATVFDDIIDVKFRNDGPTAVLIKTAWTPSNVTVKFFGTKRYEVSSRTGPKTKFTDPQLVKLPPGEQCSPSKGAPGFTATDTRTMRDVQTGETTSKTRTVRYNPQPIVQCG